MSNLNNNRKIINKYSNSFEDIEKYPIFITESQLRLKSGKRKDGSYWTYNEIVVFDFEEVEKVQPKKQTRSQKTKYRH